MSNVGHYVAEGGVRSIMIDSMPHCVIGPWLELVFDIIPNNLAIVDSYSVEVKCEETVHYFSISQHICPQITANPLLFAFSSHIYIHYVGDKMINFVCTFRYVNFKSFH